MKIFISYSHADEWLKDELIKHFSALKRRGLVDIWHDRLIPPGGRLANEIDQNLLDSEVVLLLISPDFLASDYCFTKEYLKAKERNSRGEASLVPVVVRDCDWDVDELKSFTALPRDAVAVTRKAYSRDDASQRDAAWLQVIEGLKIVIEAQKKSLRVLN